jgi:WS/DGAT/MGAT family acyltransferase
MVIAGQRSADDVRTHLEGRLGAVPRLMQRLDPGTHPPAWADDPDFSLERHVIDRGAVDEAGLRRLVRRAIETRLDREHPLWAMEVVSLSGGRTALVWRIHHAVADGATAIRMARELLLEPTAEELPARDTRPHRWPSRPAVPAVGRAAHVPKVLRQELGRRVISSPLAGHVGPRRNVAVVDAPLDELRRIGEAAPKRATVNDVALSVVSAGLRAWLDEVGASTAGVRVQVPVSLQEGKPGSANHDSFMVADLPLEQNDPIDRLVAVTRQTRRSKQRHDAGTLDDFLRGVSHLSSSRERRAKHRTMSAGVFTLNVSNLAGPSGPQLVLGAPLLELHTLAEIAHGHALRVGIGSAAGRISFGLCADPDAVDRLDLIADGIAGEIDALGELVGGTRAREPELEAFAAPRRARVRLRAPRIRRPAVQES